ncbi:MAG: YigZ family protein, partial [Lachnospiraceae bacterium]|nr:YigZ family protein [Lachnospiraceae bacterium]
MIVTRYFGGTLLGTGGLIRAYSAAAQEGLKNSRVITKLLGKRLTIQTDYNGIGKLQYVVSNLGLSVEDTLYEDVVKIKAFVAIEDCGRVEKAITEASSGQARLCFSEEDIYFAQLEHGVAVFKE